MSAKRKMVESTVFESDVDRMEIMAAENRLEKIRNMKRELMDVETRALNDLEALRKRLQHRLAR